MFKFMFPTKPFLFKDVASIAADTEAAVFIPEVWANRALSKLRVATCMVGLVVRDYENEISSQGKTVNVQKRGVLVSNSKTANKGVTLQNPTATTIPVVLANHKEVSFLVEDVAEAQANTSVLDGYVEDGAIVLAEDIDLSLCELYTEIAEAKNVELSDAIDDGSILAARTKIVVDGKAPAKQPRYLVIRDMAELLSVNKFISRDYVNGTPLEEGAVGKIHGFQVFENQNVVQTDTATVTHRLAFASGSIALVTRRLPNPPANTGVQASTIMEDGLAVRVLHGYNMTYLGLQVTIDILFGTAILRSEWLAQILEVADS